MKATHNPPLSAADVEPTPADILRGAARYLRRHGWTQGDYYTIVFDPHRPRACATGAIGMAVYGTPVEIPLIVDCPAEPEYLIAVHVLADSLGLPSVGDIFTWNDVPGRTAAEVIQALNIAADHWDALHHRGGDNA